MSIRLIKSLFFFLEEIRTMNEIFDKTAALEALAGDEEFLIELVGVYFENYPAQLGAVREAIKQDSSKMLQNAAHTVKGTVGSLCSQNCVAAAIRLEELGRSGNLQPAWEAMAALEGEILRLNNALTDLIAEKV